MVTRRHLDRTYGITENYTTSDEFLEILARKREYKVFFDVINGLTQTTGGKLHRGGEADMDGIGMKNTYIHTLLRSGR